MMNNFYDAIVIVVNVQVATNDAADWKQLRDMVKTAILQFDESLLSNFFVIFQGKRILK